MSFFRRRRQRGETPEDVEAEQLRRIEESMAAEEARIIAECHAETAPPPMAAPPPLSDAASEKVCALHAHFDVDCDGFLNFTELRNLQLVTSGAQMSSNEYAMICEALNCDPERGVTLDALRITYASAGADINLDSDYATVFGGSVGVANGEDTAHSASANEDGQMPPQEELPCDEKARLEMGDHVFKRRAAGLAQVHAIVVSMAPGDEGPLLLAKFFGKGQKSGDANRNNDDGNDDEGDSKAKAGKDKDAPDDTVEKVSILCVTGKKSIRKWKKVRYGPSKLRSWLKKKKSSADGVQDGKAKEGIPTTDPPTLVVERVNFLLENQELIPPWNALKSNTECIAVWCKTGRWSTFQVSSYLQTVFMGQAKAAASVAVAASSASVTVPAAGYMGWLGFTQTVPLLALHPMLIPAIAGYGIFAIGVPMVILKRCGSMWAKTTIELNDHFWSNADPAVFVDCIEHWSGLCSEE